jgi:hypothetical protein
MIEYTDKVLVRAMSALYKGRPYTRAIPFAKTFTGAPGNAQEIWTVKNGFFVFAHGSIFSDVAGSLYYLSDTDASTIFAMVIGDTAVMTPIDVGQETYKSNSFAAPKILVVDPIGAVTTIQGVLYIWEVTQEGVYR